MPETCDPRLVIAAQLFNQQEFFTCHDVLEELWSETVGPDRDFLQGLIHAAVSLFHFQEGNLSGARKMHNSTLNYLSGYEATHCGVDLQRLREELRICFAPLLVPHASYPSHVHIDTSLIPRLHFVKED